LGISVSRINSFAPFVAIHQLPEVGLRFNVVPVLPRGTKPRKEAGSFLGVTGGGVGAISDEMMQNVSATWRQFAIAS
jgi:hypothetical protein